MVGFFSVAYSRKPFFTVEYGALQLTGLAVDGGIICISVQNTLSSIIHKAHLMQLKKVALMTSGGDAPGMNACLRAVVRATGFYGIDIVGINNGYQGLIEGDFVELDMRSVSFILNQGGTMLFTARSGEFRTQSGRRKAIQHLEENGVDGLIVIGGDGSFRGAQKLSEESNVKVIGVPATIDNDIFGTDQCIGFDTALNTATEAIDKIRDTATSHNRLFIVEVMGRDSGALATRVGISTGAKAVLVPERKLSDDELFAQLRKGVVENKKSNIIVIAEGNTSGNAYEISTRIAEKFPQFDIRVTVLGHLQRGGSPSATDRILASRLGVAAVEGLIDGESDVMVGVEKGSICRVPLSEVVKQNGIDDDEYLRIANILSI